MPIIVEFHASRDNLDHDFFWESKDPVAETICTAVKNLAEVCEVPHSFTILEDNMSAVSSFTLPTLDYWTGFTGLIRYSTPTALEIRNNYFNNSGHRLVMEIKNAETNELIHVQQMIPAA
jgi:hypothetical protein